MIKKHQVRIFYSTMFIFTCLTIITPLSVSKDKIAANKTELDANEYSWDELDVLCGPNCLQQIAYAYGENYSLQVIINMAGTNPKDGTSIKGMVDAASKMGLRAMPVKINIKSLIELKCVVILLLRSENIGHYVIFDKIEDGQIRILDGYKFRNLSTRELQSIWDGYAILIGDYENINSNNTRRYIGQGLQISGLLILIILAIYGIKNTFMHLSKNTIA